MLEAVSIMKAAGDCDQWQAVLSVAAHWDFSALSAPSLIHNCAIEICARCGRPDEAVELLSKLLQAGGAPTSKSLDAVVTCLCRDDGADVPQAMAVLRSAKDAGVEPWGSTRERVILTACRLEAWQAVAEMHWEMETSHQPMSEEVRRQVKTAASSHSALSSALAGLGARRSLLQVLRERGRRREGDRAIAAVEKSCLPSPVPLPVSNVLMSVLLSCGRTAEAVAVTRSLKAERVEADTETLSMLLVSLARLGDAADAARVASEMTGMGMRPPMWAVEQAASELVHHQRFAQACQVCDAFLIPHRSASRALLRLSVAAARGAGPPWLARAAQWILRQGPGLREEGSCWLLGACAESGDWRTSSLIIGSLAAPSAELVHLAVEACRSCASDSPDAPAAADSAKRLTHLLEALRVESEPSVEQDARRALLSMKARGQAPTPRALLEAALDIVEEGNAVGASELSHAALSLGASHHRLMERVVCRLAHQGYLEQAAELSRSLPVVSRGTQRALLRCAALNADANAAISLLERFFGGSSSERISVAPPLPSSCFAWAASACEAGRWLEASQFSARWAVQHHYCSRPPPRACYYGWPLRACAEAGLGRDALGLLRELQARSSAAGSNAWAQGCIELCFMNAMQACAKARLIDDLLALEVEARESQVPPWRSKQRKDLVAGANLLVMETFSKIGRPQDVLSRLDALECAGAPPDLRGYVHAIKALGNVGRTKDALNVLEKEGSLYTPSVHSYVAALKACELTFSTADALKVLRDMKSRGVMPNRASYHCAIKACGADYRAALGLLEDMRRDSLEPGENCLKAALQACNRACQFGESEGLVQEMVAGGIAPHVVEALKGGYI
jgi:pentatricopeptide repeat protein